MWLSALSPGLAAAITLHLAFQDEASEDSVKESPFENISGGKKLYQTRCAIEE